MFLRKKVVIHANDVTTLIRGLGPRLSESATTFCVARENTFYSLYDNSSTYAKTGSQYESCIMMYNNMLCHFGNRNFRGLGEV